jgi:hypothetical protein
VPSLVHRVTTILIAYRFVRSRFFVFGIWLATCGRLLAASFVHSALSGSFRSAVARKCWLVGASCRAFLNSKCLPTSHPSASLSVSTCTPHSIPHPMCECDCGSSTVNKYTMSNHAQDVQSENVVATKPPFARFNVLGRIYMLRFSKRNSATSRSLQMW